MNTAVATALDRLIESYREGGLSRREFFQRLAYLTGSIVLAHEIMLDTGLAAEWEIYNWPDPPAQPADVVSSYALNYFFGDPLSTQPAVPVTSGHANPSPHARRR